MKKIAIGSLGRIGRQFLNLGIVLMTAIFIFASFPFSVNAFFYQNPTLNLNISFSFDGQNILDKGIYEVSLNKQKQNIFVYPQSLSGDVYAEIYKGELNNSQLIFSFKTDKSGILKSQNTFSSEGKYFVILYQTATTSDWER